MTDCEICRNHELCRLENKDKIKNCFYVYPTKEYLASKTEEYRLGYNKAIDDFKEELFKNSERVRPVGWFGYSEIVTCEKIYGIAEDLKGACNRTIKGRCEI